MMALALRGYQRRAVDLVFAAWSRGRRAPLLCAPTGSGKTVIAAEIARRMVGQRRRVLFLAPRRELVDQAFAKLTACNLSVGVVMAGDPRRMDWASAYSVVFHHKRGDAVCAVAFGKHNQRATAELLTETFQPDTVDVLIEVDA
jgi:superfamily II DNA or RNA helicase